MATVVNNAGGTGGNDGGGVNAIVGVIVLLVLVFLIVMYGIPMLRSAGTTTTAPQINVPGKVDVNVNKGGK